MLALSAWDFSGVAEGEEESVVERGIVARDGFAEAHDGVAAVWREVGGAGKIAAEGVDGDGVGFIEAADEIGDGVFGVDEAAVHEIAGVEKNEDVRTDESIATLLTGHFADLFGFGRGRQKGLHRAVGQDLHGGAAAFGESGELLRDAVFGDFEIGRFEAVDVFAFVVGDGEA
jgi:hypothetical protein